MRRMFVCIVSVCLLSLPAWGQEQFTPAQKSRVNPVVLAYRKAQPAVVNIAAQQVVERGMDIFGGDDPLEQIFPSPLKRRMNVQSLGSGVIIHPSGYIVTNAHVVRQAQKVTVILVDKSEHEAKIIAADSAHDLAVLKIAPPGGKPLPHIPMGRSDDLMVGEGVIAIGNPMGYANSVTTGVISAVDRELEFGGGIKYSHLIQTDAPINPGNSGGPLLNVSGELIGINTAIRGDAQNIGFAIPADALATELGGLLNFERINRVVFGATVSQRHGEQGEELIVSAVKPGTPAAASLQKGDRLLAIDGARLRGMADYTCGMLGATGDQPLKLLCARGGKQFETMVQLKAKSKPDGAALAWSLLGLKLKPVDRKLARETGLSVDHGLLVMDVEASSPAAAVGVKKNDVLFQLSKFYVKDLDDLAAILEEVQASAALRIGIVRGNVAAWANLKVRGYD